MDKWVYTPWGMIKESDCSADALIKLQGATRFHRVSDVDAMLDQLVNPDDAKGK